MGTQTHKWAPVVAHKEFYDSMIPRLIQNEINA